jgi:beta-lactam-binding protein with PASTA domain
VSRGGWIAVVIVFVVAVALVAVGVFYRRPPLVPDLRMKSTAEATAMITDAGLKLGRQGKVASETIGPDLVTEQWPAPNAEVARDSAVDVTVTVAPTLETVPDVHGLDVNVAEKTLADALYDVQVVDIFSAAKAPGTVIQQSPANGTQWITGGPVAIAAVVGPDDGTGVAVPKVKGLDSKDAFASLGKAGLSGAGVLANPSAVEQLVVVKQLPGKGILVRPGATVYLLLDEPK